MHRKKPTIVNCNFCQDPSIVNTFHVPKSFLFQNYQKLGGQLAWALAHVASEGRKLLVRQEIIIVPDSGTGFVSPGYVSPEKILVLIREHSASISSEKVLHLSECTFFERNLTSDNKIHVHRRALCHSPTNM